MKMRIIKSFVGFLLIASMMGQESTYLAQKLMLENDLRSRIESALQKVMDDHRYVLDVTVDLKFTPTVTEEVTFRPAGSDDAKAAVAGADVVVADTFVSMGDKDAEKRLSDLAPFMVDDNLMGAANGGAVFLHCLPAHRGEEVSASVIDGTQSVVWDEAENRLHAQMALLLKRLDIAI